MIVAPNELRFGRRLFAAMFRSDGARAVGGVLDPVENISATPNTPLGPSFEQSSNLLALWLYYATGALLLLVVLTWLTLEIRGISGIPAYYFWSQDVILLFGSAISLIVAARLTGYRLTLAGISSPAAIAAIIAICCATYFGASIVMMRYPMSRDEQLADFAATYLRNGSLGWPIPSGLDDLAKAMMPVWTDGWLSSGYWVSNYLPVNSALRAVVGWAGDAWLTGPLLLAIGLIALWDCAGRLWPGDRQVRTVVLLLALTSSQLLTNAMTPYATTAHFAFNVVWLSFFLRGGRLGHTAALLLGLLATGIHQFHFHIMFVAGFVIWAWLSGRRNIAFMYAAACAVYIGIWQIAYIRLVMISSLGPMTADPTAPPLAFSSTLAHLDRLRELEPFTSFSRFAAWQNPLMLPLAALGCISVRRRSGPLPVTFAFQISCLIGLSTMLYQGFGYGYRYLHGLLPCFLLLAGAGWVHLRTRLRRPVPVAPLAVTSLFAACFMIPFSLWQSHALLKPYASAFRLARATSADVVLFDSRDAGFLQDVIRIDTRIDRPLLLDIAYVPAARLRSLCRTQRVAIFDKGSADALGLMGTGAIGDPRYPALATARKHDLARLQCGERLALA